MSPDQLIWLVGLGHVLWSPYRRSVCGGVADCDLNQSSRFHGSCREADVERRSVICEWINPVREGDGLLLSRPGNLTIYGVDQQRRVGVQDQGVDPSLDRDQIQNQPAAHLLHGKVQPQVQVEVSQLEAPEVRR